MAQLQDRHNTFLQFLRKPIFLFKTIGKDLYEHSDNSKRHFAYQLLFIAGFVNFDALVFGEFILFIKTIKSASTILEATAVGPCIGFSVVANVKQIALVAHKHTLRKHLDELELMFPLTPEKRLAYKLNEYNRTMQRIMNICTVFCLGFIFTFSYYPACKLAVQYYLLHAQTLDHDFAFPIWYPYNTTANSYVYSATYISQIHAGYVAGVSYLAADLLLASSITQLCMHFNYITEQLEQFEGVSMTKNTAGKDVALQHEESIAFLQNIIEYHTKCLELSEHVNNIFSLSLLMNFLAASLTICFTGFQVIAGTLEDILKFLIFLMESLVQVFVVCYYGDELMTASNRVGDAAYNQNWFNCNTKYKRMLVLIIQRSQKAASIRAPTFPPISFNTFMKVIGMSYQFFALLRTVYFGN